MTLQAFAAATVPARQTALQCQCRGFAGLPDRRMPCGVVNSVHALVVTGTVANGACPIRAAIGRMTAARSLSTDH